MQVRKLFTATKIRDSQVQVDVSGAIRDKIF